MRARLRASTMLEGCCQPPRPLKVCARGLLCTGRDLPVLAQSPCGPGWRYDRRIVDRFELAINRTRGVFTAFATAAAIGGMVGSPAALADPEPPPPPPVAVPELQCTGLPWMPCEEYWVPSPPLPDTPGAPDRP